MLTDALAIKIFEDSPCGILVVGPDGIIREANKRALAMFGWGSESAWCATSLKLLCGLTVPGS